MSERQEVLKNRINACLSGINYAINETFFKGTLRTILEYIETSEEYMETLEKTIAELQEELKAYRDAEEEANNKLAEMKKN